MPEGPEVRVVADQLAQILVNRYIVGISFGARPFQQGLHLIPRCTKIIAVTAYAKRIIFGLSNGGYIISFLGMEGKWTWEKDKHTSVVLHLGYKLDRFIVADLDLYYDNSRPIGYVNYYPDMQGALTCFLNIGIDILINEIDSQSFNVMLRKKSGLGRKLCVFLLDQKYLAGIGNYLRCEIMYHAKLRPDRTLGSLTDDEIERLRLMAHYIIREAYKAGGLTISSFWAPDGSKGMFARQVYDRDTDFYGNQVVREQFDSDRTVHWVPAVQV